MITLDFKGPYTLNSVNNVNDKYAVYIWGFKEPLKDRFIPYYVGEVCGTSISNRFKSRYMEINKVDSTYLRISDDYLFGLNDVIPFYKDFNFPPNLNNIEFPTGGRFFNKWNSRNKGIAYLNSWRWGGFTNKTKYTLNEHLKETPSFFDSLALRYNDVVVYYSEIKHEEINALKKDSIFSTNYLCDQIIIEMCEAYTKYCLKGKTVSRANYLSEKDGTIKKSYKNLSGIDAELIRLSNFISVFNNSQNIFKSSPSVNFPGY